MTIRSIALSAMAVTFSLCAADLSVAPLAVYYSFDTPPSAALVTEMQSEVGRILAAAGVRVAWRAVNSPRNGEDYQGIVVFQFRGVCSFDQDSAVYEPQAEPTGQPLAETDIADGRVLPFGAVECDRLRRFIAPVLKSLGPEDKNASLGRAIARVSAHEIYHMLTRSEGHARRGIARSSHSRAELTAPRFGFAQKETDWLRAWVIKPAGQLVVAAVEVGADTVPTDSAEPESISSAGR
jgi:hypothetical protein